jgi:hypothetical protein
LAQKSGGGLAGGEWRETTTGPDRSQTLVTYDLWRNATEQQKDSGGDVIGSTTRASQGAGGKLLASVTDARTGETEFTDT